MAPIHQHHFCARLDFDLDGCDNTVFEVDSDAMPEGPDNPMGNAVRVKRTPLEREAEACREPQWRTGRYWLITNEKRLNRLGKPIGYKLMPSDSVAPLALPAADVKRRAAFLDPPVRVSRYARDEHFAAGWYPNQRTETDGIAYRQVERDAEIRNQDLVVWFSFG